MSANQEIKEGERFPFGENWARFLRLLDEDRIAQAERSLREMLEVSDLKGKTFLDVGSGSGLFSLAARRVGARVHSFDYDLESVACTQELKRRFFADDSEWTVEHGSVLDPDYLASLGRFDVVYSWGVLHHTGAMWDAIANVQACVAEGGSAYLALYNDQGRMSDYWTWAKRAYNRLPPRLRFLVLWPAFVYLWGPMSLADLLKGHPFRTWRDYSKENRGMSPWRDVIDWVGGYPFEVAKPEEVFDFFRDRGFDLRRLKTWAGAHGCNEYVFARRRGHSAA